MRLSKHSTCEHNLLSLANTFKLGVYMCNLVHTTFVFYDRGAGEYTLYLRYNLSAEHTVLAFILEVLLSNTILAIAFACT